jgi:hypothetical protein
VRSILPFLIVCALGACEGHPDVDLPAPDKPHNVQVLLPQVPGKPDLWVDIIGANKETRDGADAQPPIAQAFRFTCGRGNCIRFNLFLRGIGWAAGENCREKPEDSYIWPVMVKGDVGSARKLLACCPHNAPCNTKNPNIPYPVDEGGAWWIVGVLPNGKLATTVKELESICPDDVRGAFDYDPDVFANFGYPTP